MKSMMELMKKCPSSIMMADVVDAVLRRQLSILSPIMLLLGAYNEIVLDREGRSILVRGFRSLFSMARNLFAKAGPESIQALKGQGRSKSSRCIRQKQHEAKCGSN